jgi:hypothetical protein
VILLSYNLNDLLLKFYRFRAQSKIFSNLA